MEMKSDAQWQAEMDAETLAAAQAIEADGNRKGRAVEAMRQRIKDAEATVAALAPADNSALFNRGYMKVEIDS